jgi:hypothetical protein
VTGTIKECPSLAPRIGSTRPREFDVGRKAPAPRGLAFSPSPLWSAASSVLRASMGFACGVVPALPGPVPTHGGGCCANPSESRRWLAIPRLGSAPTGCLPVPGWPRSDTSSVPLASLQHTHDTQPAPAMQRPPPHTHTRAEKERSQRSPIRASARKAPCLKH